MAKTCDICGGKTGFLKTFHCLDGVVCKDCYKIVSGNYANTIAQMTLMDLKKLYIKNAQPLDMGEGGFRTTQKIGAFLLLDENNRKFCILNNQKMTGQNTRPEIFAYRDLESVSLISQPSFSPQQLAVFAADKHNETAIRKLSVRLTIRGKGTREITVIPTPVRVSSYAFRQGLKVAEEILACLDAVKIS